MTEERGAWSEDHAGNRHESAAAMAAAWGVPKDTYYYRIKSGRGVEKALTEPVRKAGATDPDGREWPDEKAMCEAWGRTTRRSFPGSRTDGG